MYGSDSSSVPTSRIASTPDSIWGRQSRSSPARRPVWPVSTPPRRVLRVQPLSCRVLGVDAYVLLREVGEEHLGLGALARQADLVFQLAALDGLEERVLVVGDRGAPGADGDALDRHVHGQRRRPGQRAADSLDDASPVGV